MFNGQFCPIELFRAQQARCCGIFPIISAPVITRKTRTAVPGGRNLKLSDKVTMSMAYTACKTNRPVIVFLNRVSPIQFFKKLHTILKKPS
jgi:hypothetical protein